MKTVCAKDMCAGCMACINMCKKSAITIVDDYKTYNAVIDEVKCVNCGLCEKICPNVKCVEQVNPIFWKEGWALNPEIRSNASSGGIASSIIYSFIKNGGSRMFFFENLEKGFDFAMKKILPKEYLKNEIKIILSKVGIRR